MRFDRVLELAVEHGYQDFETLYADIQSCPYEHMTGGLFDPEERRACALGVIIDKFIRRHPETGLSWGRYLDGLDEWSSTIVSRDADFDPSCQEGEVPYMIASRLVAGLPITDSDIFNANDYLNDGSDWGAVVSAIEERRG